MAKRMRTDSKAIAPPPPPPPPAAMPVATADHRGPAPDIVVQIQDQVASLFDTGQTAKEIADALKVTEEVVDWALQLAEDNAPAEVAEATEEEMAAVMDQEVAAIEDAIAPHTHTYEKIAGADGVEAQMCTVCGETVSFLAETVDEAPVPLPPPPATSQPPLPPPPADAAPPLAVRTKAEKKKFQADQKKLKEKAQKKEKAAKAARAVPKDAIANAKPSSMADVPEDLMLNNSLRPLYKLLEHVYFKTVQFIGEKTDDSFFDKMMTSHPVIVIQSKGQRSLTGWCAPERWASGEDKINEITITAELLTRQPEEIIETLIHEAVHHGNALHKVQDCTASGRHNAKFKARAEQIGLTVTKDGYKGWAKTELGEDLVKFVDSLEIDGDVFGLARLIPEKKETKPSNVLKYICSCDRPIRATVDITSQEFGPVFCQKCQTWFALADGEQEKRDARATMVVDKAAKKAAAKTWASFKSAT